MAGLQRTGPYPQPYGPLNPGPMIPGFTAEQSAAYNNPAAPEGYNNWTDYVLDVLNASDAYQPGHPETARLGIGGDNDPLYHLTNNMGYGRLAPLVDTSNPRIRSFLDNTYYSNTSWDTFSPWGDQFSTALMGLGLATGGAGAYGAFGAAAAEAGGAGLAAGAIEAGGLGAAALAPDVVAPITAGAGGALGATPTTLAPATSGLWGTLSAAAPYATYGGTGLQVLGAATGEENLSKAGMALSLAGGAASATGGIGSGSGSGLFGKASPYVQGASTGAKVLGAATGTNELSTAGGILNQAGGAGGGKDMADWGSTKDWIDAATAAAGVGNSIYSGINAAGAQGQASDAAALQAQIARQLFDEASGLRQTNLNSLNNFALTGNLPTPLATGLGRIMTTGREGLESQYNVARANILGGTPMRGGQLNAALADLEMRRAGSVGRLGADVLGQYELPLRQNVYNMGVNAGVGQSTTGLSALGGSATNFMNLAQQAGKDASASGQATGALLALLLRNQQAKDNPVGGSGFQNPTIGTGLSTDPFSFSNVGYRLSPEELAYAYSP